MDIRGQNQRKKRFNLLNHKCQSVMLQRIFIMTLAAGNLFLPLSSSEDLDKSRKEYPDGHGGSVYFPLGDISFADEVVSFEKGDPFAADQDSRPEETLGIPDYDQAKEDNYTTLGCGGVLTLQFIDNVLIDIEGPDLHVFEIGPAIEPTNLAISKDGREWIEIGKISGGRADIDISQFTEPGEVFHYVRLTDLKTDCGGAWPGADIDAVGAIGSALRISLKSSVLFDFDKSTLKPEAKKELHEAALKIKEYPNGRIMIEGHTDGIGTEAYNSELSMKRAAAVKDYFVSQEGMQSFDIRSSGFGESRPIASNDTEEGRAKNRRVEIILLPEENH